MEQQKFKERCKIHSEEKVQFFKINNSTQKLKSQPFFTCILCMTSGGFNLQDYCVIKEIIKGNKKILQKWPPMNNEEIMKKLIEIVSEQSSSNSNDNIIDEIMSYYKNLKVLILEQIDLSQKKMIQIAEKLPLNNNAEQIIKEYQNISKLDQLRDLLLNNSIKIEDKQRVCTQLIEQSQSQNTTQQLSSLLNTYEQKITFNTEPDKFIMKSIIKNIKRIKLFQVKDTIPSQSINNIQLFQQNNSIPIQSLQLNPTIINNIDIKFMHSNYKNGQDCFEINTNNNKQQQVRVKNEGYFIQVVSNMILQRDKKYVMRLKIDHLNRHNYVSVGLIQDLYIHTSHGTSDDMSCYLTNDGKQIVKYNQENKGIQKQLKGEGFVLSDNREIEIRISLRDKILHLLDYPNYQYKLGLADQFVNRLNNRNDLRLFIGLEKLHNTVIITHASTVNSFD